MESRTAISSLFSAGFPRTFLFLLCGLPGHFPGWPFFDRLTFSLFIISITEDFGCARSDVTLIQTICSFSQVLGSFCVWSIYEKVGMIRTLRLTAFFLPAVYFCYALSNHLLVFYLVAGLRGFLTGLAATTASVHIIKRNFPNNYGMPLGIAQMGAGFGGFVFNNVAAKLMESFT